MAWKSFARLKLLAVGGTIGLVGASALILVGPPVAAPAAVGDVSCLGGSGTITFSPGATLVTHTSQFSVTGSLGTCVSLSHLDITGGSFVLSGSTTGNCTTGGSGSGVGTVVFNDPAHTTSSGTLSYTVGLVAGIPVMTVSAVGTGGAFQGDHVTGLPLSAAFNPADCLRPGGLTTATFGNTTVLAG